MDHHIEQTTKLNDIGSKVKFIMKENRRQLLQQQPMKIIPGIVNAETDEIKDRKSLSMYIAKEQ